MLKIEGLNDTKGEFCSDEAGTIEAPAEKEEGAEQKLDEAALRRKAAESIYGSEEEVAGPVGENWLKLEEESKTFTVTKINPGVRDQNRVNVFLDGHFAFSLDVTQVIDFGVKVGQKITPERLTELQTASEFGKLYQRTLEWALTRPHSVLETKNYLKRRQIKRRQLNRQRVRDEKKPLNEFEDEVVELVVERLIERGFLNDQKFAEYYVENRYIRKGISQKRLRLELRQKGVEQDIIANALEKIPRPEDEEIKKIIAKKRRKYDDFQLIGYLVRQGFNFQQAKEAVEASKREPMDMWM